jgi:hypothetical protein
VLGDLIAAVAHHDNDMSRFDGGGSFEYVAEEGSAGDGVKNLGEGGLHPLAFAGGQDDDNRGARGR